MNKNKKGGPREGAGRKPVDGTKPKMKSVKLSQEHWDKARQIGDGKNMAKGIRRALDAFTQERVVEHIVDELLAMSEDDRLEVFSHFCRHCGRNDKRCQCWNDD